LACVDRGGGRLNDLLLFRSYHPREPGGGHFADERTAKRMRSRIGDCIDAWFRWLEESDKFALGFRRGLTSGFAFLPKDTVSFLRLFIRLRLWRRAGTRSNLSDYANLPGLARTWSLVCEGVARHPIKKLDWETSLLSTCDFEFPSAHRG